MKIDKDTIKQMEIVSREARKIAESYERGIHGWAKKTLLINSSDFQTAIFAAEQIEIILRAQKELAEQMSTDRLEDIQMMASIALEFVPLIQCSLSFNSHIVEKLENTYIELPPTNFQLPLNEFSNFTNTINEFNSYKNSKDDYLLRTTSIETTDVGNIKLRTIQQTQLQVQSLQEDFNQHKNNFTEDSKKKDEMLKELLDYYQNGGSNIVKVKKVTYNKKNAELIIDDIKINIRANTSQHYICNVLFADKETIKRVWELDDVVEAIGEHIWTDKNWKSIIYNTIRHLNNKIQIQTGIEKFILYDNKTIIVNPKYLDLN